MVELEKFGFTENPFSLLPDSRVTNWAGRKEIRIQMEDIVESILATDTGLSEFIILHGNYGAGKSHALRYFATKINDDSNLNARAVYIPKVKVSEKISFLSLYRQIFQDFGRQFIIDLAKKIERSIKSEEDLRANQMDTVDYRNLTKSDGDALLRKVIEDEIPKELQPMVNLLISIANEGKKELDYLMDGTPALTGTDYSQKIESDYVAVKVLANLIQVATIKIGNQSPALNGVHLFIDEVEDILEAKAAEQASFWTAIRELVNRLPEYFALILAFSADAALLEAIMPMALAERTSRQNIDLPALEIDEAKEFIQSHLKDFRPDDFSGSNPYYPFEEDAIDYLLEQIVVIVPRKIFRVLRQVMERSIRREGLKPGEEITAAMAEEIVLSLGL